DGLRGRSVARVVEKARLGIALLIAEMLGQLGLQTTLEASLDELLDEPTITIELDLARVDFREQIIEHARIDQTLRALRLSLPPRLTRLLVDSQCHASFRKETHP